MTTPRITEIIGYSAETSAPNETPRWGHFTASWADEAQERFEAWIAANRVVATGAFPQSDSTAPVAPSLALARYEAWADGLPADEIASEVRGLANSIREYMLAVHERDAIPLDPKPYYVAEVDEGQGPDAGRYTVEAVRESANDGEWGGIVYNLASLAPRRDYSQNKEDYR
jgi:hypothetical protein